MDAVMNYMYLHYTHTPKGVKIIHLSLLRIKRAQIFALDINFSTLMIELCERQDLAACRAGGRLAKRGVGGPPPPRAPGSGWVTGVAREGVKHFGCP